MSHSCTKQLAGGSLWDTDWDKRTVNERMRRRIWKGTWIYTVRSKISKEWERQRDGEEDINDHTTWTHAAWDRWERSRNCLKSSPATLCCCWSLPGIHLESWRHRHVARYRWRHRSNTRPTDVGRRWFRRISAADISSSAGPAHPRRRWNVFCSAWRAEWDTDSTWPGWGRVDRSLQQRCGHVVTQFSTE